MSYIRVDQAIPVFDGQPVTFKSPANCSGIEGLKVYYPAADGTAVATFALADAHGNNVGSINLFAANVLVKVILDTESGKAFVQNADTNAYLEGRFEGKAEKEHTHKKSEISDFPTSMPASDVPAWAKAANKPTYTASEVGARPNTWMPTAADVGALPSSGGELTGNLSGKYLIGTWLRTTQTTNLNARPTQIAVLNGAGWIYYRTPEELLNDIGAASKVDVPSTAVVTVPAGRMMGDVDGDGKITTADSDLAKNWRNLDETQQQLADMNGDGKIGAAEIAQIRSMALGLVKIGQGSSDILGNWTVNPNYANEDAQFYTDIAITEMTATSSAVLSLAGTSEQGNFSAVCMDGALRVYAKLCPIAELKGIVQYSSSGDGTAAVVLQSEHKTETWTFTLEDGSTVTKAVYVG